MPGITEREKERRGEREKRERERGGEREKRVREF